MEENKDSDEIIGKTLIIDCDEFKNIDDILERYIEPMNKRVKEIMIHIKFMDKSKEGVEKKLSYLNRFRNNQRIFYFTWSEGNAGYFSLMYTTRYRVKKSL